MNPLPKEVLIDPWDRIMAENFSSWSVGSHGYVWTYKNYKNIYLARFILAASDNIVDHVNGNKLDNRRINLRLCSNKENCTNRAPNNGKKYKGVLLRSNGMYQSRIHTDGIPLYLGTFNTEDEAAEAYNKAAILFHGEFARLNIITY